MHIGFAVAADKVDIHIKNVSAFTLLLFRQRD